VRDCLAGLGFVEGHAADPFPAVSQTAHTLDVVGTGVGGWEEIPECVRVFSKVRELLGWEEGDSGVLGMGKGRFMAERDAGAP